MAMDDLEPSSDDAELDFHASISRTKQHFAALPCICRCAVQLGLVRESVLRSHYHGTSEEQQAISTECRLAVHAAHDDKQCSYACVSDGKDREANKKKWFRRKMLTSKIPLEQIGNEHECMDCGGTCFCQAGASDKFSCVHACEMDEYEDYEDALNEADLMVDPFRFGENF